MKRIILFGLLAALGFLWFQQGTSDPFWDAPSGIIQLEPLQSAVDIGSFDMVDYGFFPHTFQITPRANYDIMARLLHKRLYLSDKYEGDLIPYDLAFGWGAMSDTDILSSFFLFDHKPDTFGGRMLWVTWQLNKGEDSKAFPASIGDPMQQVSNNHVIPANKAVFRQLAALKTGDMVRLRGYLVDITDKQRIGWHWGSSLTRQDTATHWGGNNTNCETIYVTGVEKILSLDPLIIEPAPEFFWPF